MRKKQYKGIVNQAITDLEQLYAGKNRRAIINIVYDYINDNGLIPDHSRTSLYNTIYYFLRKKGLFGSNSIQYRFDSIDSKLKFLDEVKNDLIDRWWFYSELFFENNDIPVVQSNINLVSGNINYIIDSKINPTFDYLYTLLYFRDLRKILSSDMSTVFIKRELNSNLYMIISKLYDLDRTIKESINTLSPIERKKFVELSNNFFRFLGEFNVNEYNKFLGDMIKHIKMFKDFMKNSPMHDVLKYNKDRFFDSITFVNIIYMLMIKAANITSCFEFSNIHYLINSTTYFVYFKFARKLKGSHFNKLVDYFNSDYYFSYSKYIIKYYNMFYTEVPKIIENSNKSSDVIYSFDIVLRYMLYNKFRSLINSNIKKFLSIDFDMGDSSFMDIDALNDSNFFDCNIYSITDPCEDITNQRFNAICEDFFSNNDSISRQDVTNAAIDIQSGKIKRNRYTPESIKAGKKLLRKLKELES